MTAIAEILAGVKEGNIDPAQAASLIAAAQPKRNGNGKAFRATLSEYRGHPTVSFEGDFRPFSLGRSKVERILAHEKELRAILK